MSTLPPQLTHIGHSGAFCHQYLWNVRANICRRNRTLFDNYSVLSFDNISHCRPWVTSCHVSLQFPLSSFGQNQLLRFESDNPWHDINRSLMCICWFLVSIIIADGIRISILSKVWDRCGSGLYSLIGFVRPLSSPDGQTLQMYSYPLPFTGLCLVVFECT